MVLLEKCYISLSLVSKLGVFHFGLYIPKKENSKKTMTLSLLNISPSQLIYHFKSPSLAHKTWISNICNYRQLKLKKKLHRRFLHVLWLSRPSLTEIELGSRKKDSTINSRELYDSDTSLYFQKKWKEQN